MTSRWKQPGPFRMTAHMGRLYEADKAEQAKVAAQADTRLNGRSRAPSPPAAHQPAAPSVSPLPEPEPPANPVREAKETLRRTKRKEFAVRHHRLMQRLARQPWSVRTLARVLDTLTLGCARSLHLYADGHSFVKAHAGGLCDVCARGQRAQTCATCSGYYEHDGHGFCKGCNCGEWAASRITHKVKLAWWVCPEDKFGPEPGWFGRLIRWLFHREEANNGNNDLDER